jgi:hypothetical protein
MMCEIDPVTLVQMLASLVFHIGLATEALQCRFGRGHSALPAGFKLVFDLFSATLALPHEASTGAYLFAFPTD